LASRERLRFWEGCAQKQIVTYRVIVGRKIEMGNPTVSRIEGFGNSGLELRVRDPPVVQKENGVVVTLNNVAEHALVFQLQPASLQPLGEHVC
jgi:hypothetical protein